MTDASISTPEVFPTNGHLLRKLGLAAVIAAIADWLFFGHKVGIAAAIFIVVLEIGVFLANPVSKNSRAILSASGILLVALLPLVEAINPISLLIGAAGAAYFWWHFILLPYKTQERDATFSCRSVSCSGPDQLYHS